MITAEIKVLSMIKTNTTNITVKSAAVWTHSCQWSVAATMCFMGGPAQK